MLVAVIGTTLSAYLYTWQSNEEVEEEKAMGRILLSQYFIVLATAAVLFKAGQDQHQ